MTDSLHPTVAGLDGDDTEIASSTPWLTAQDPKPPFWPASLLALWFLGAGVMAVRLLAGVAYSLRLIWSSTVITPNDLAEKSVRFQWLTNDERPAITCECPLIRVPMALGVQTHGTKVRFGCVGGGDLGALAEIVARVGLFDPSIQLHLAKLLELDNFTLGEHQTLQRRTEQLSTAIFQLELLTLVGQYSAQYAWCWSPDRQRAVGENWERRRDSTYVARLDSVHDKCDAALADDI